MGQSYRGHWKVYIVTAEFGTPADPDGTHYGVTFSGGFAYVNWKTLGEAATEVAIEALGSDPRFQVVEIPEHEYFGQTK